MGFVLLLLKVARVHLDCLVSSSQRIRVDGLRNDEQATAPVSSAQIANIAADVEALARGLPVGGDAGPASLAGRKLGLQEEIGPRGVDDALLRPQR